jgi:hypothetical protein
MKPYADNIQTFAAMFEGFAGAAGRFNDATKGCDPTAAFIPLFEALNWAVALDDRAAKRWTPEGKVLGWEWREKVPGAEIMRGVRFVRNSVHHDWSDALTLDKGGRAYPKTFPVVYFEWRWRAAGELPEPGRKDKAGEEVYGQELEGQPARVTLETLTGALRFLREAMEPSSLPRASVPTVDLLITTDEPSDPMYGED